MLAMFAACSEEPSAPKATNKPSASANVCIGLSEGENHRIRTP
jgi:hypothetical protein